MSSKPKRWTKAAKPDCKVWIQVGEEVLAEHLHQPLDGVEGSECYVVVALGDVITVHCQAKSGIVDEFVLVADGIIRACEQRRNTTLVFDKVLHRAEGRGKQQGAVFRSDMQIQIHNEKESKLAEDGKKPSEVGAIVIEGWRKKDTDSTDSKNNSDEILKFATFEDHREWYDKNRFINSAPHHLPQFEVGFIHAKNRCPRSTNGPRERVESAATRKASKWELSYQFVFNFRPATELHKLGQLDVPVRNPKSGLFAEDHAQDAADPQGQTAEPETEEIADKAAEKHEEKVAAEPRSSSQANGDLEMENKKSKFQETPAVPQETVSGLLSQNAKPASEEVSAEPATPIEPIPEEQRKANSPANSTANSGISHGPAQVSNVLGSDAQKAEEPSNKAVSRNETENEEVSKPARATHRKSALPGLKSAPASKVSKDRLSTQDSDALSKNLDPDQALPSTEISFEPSILSGLDEQLSKLTCSAEALRPGYLTPPQSARKNKPNASLPDISSMLVRRNSVPISSSLKNGRAITRKLSDSRLYFTSPTNFTISHVQRAIAAVLSADVGPQSKETSVVSKVPELGRAQSETSDAPTEVADPAEVEVSVKRSQRTNSSASSKTSQRSGEAENGFSQASHEMSERQYHTKPSPILRSPSSSFMIHAQEEEHTTIPAKQVRQQWQEREVAPQDSPSSQIRLEASLSFDAAHPSAPGQTSEARRAELPAGEKKAVGGSSFAAVQASGSGRPLPTSQRESLGKKRKVDNFTGNGPEESHRPRKSSVAPAEPSIPEQTGEDRRTEVLAGEKKAVGSGPSFAVQANGSGRPPLILQQESLAKKRKVDDIIGNGQDESHRPRKSSVAPAARSLSDTLRQQEEENDRLQKELEDLRIHNAALENIRELRRQNESVKQRIDAEKARQAALEAELGH